MKSVKGRLLYLIDIQTGLLFKQMSLFFIDMYTHEEKFICALPINKRIEQLSRARLLSRLKRLEPKCAGRLSETEFVVSLLRSCWLIDIAHGTCEKIYDNPEGFSEVINFCSVEDGVYWGDYGRNTGHQEVKVYHLNKDHQISVVYSFPAGSVRHIHNIVEDVNGFVLFVGDNETEAGIYKVNKDWSEVKPWKTGQQKYRAVVGYPYNGGVLYATDSVETENHLRFITAEGEEKILASLNGSCIYGCETKDDYLFSTTVEPHEGGGLKSLFIDSLGGGIKSRDVTIMAVSKKDLTVRQVVSFRKDGWPMKLFQYGRCIFAGGQENQTGAWGSPVACMKYDGKTIMIELQ